MQVDTTTSTRWCPRCQSHLPHSAFGSHNYCRSCYRNYLLQWKAERRDPKRDRHAAVFAAIREDRCLICGDSDMGNLILCKDCAMADMLLGGEDNDEAYADRLRNLLDLYDGRFDAAIKQHRKPRSKN